MGTGSVALWFLRLFRVCRRCLSPFSTTRLQFELVTKCRPCPAHYPATTNFPSSSSICRSIRWARSWLGVTTINMVPSFS